MRFIRKRVEPNCLKQFKLTFQNQHGREPHYSDLRGEDYNNVKVSFLEEQHYLCGYCMKQVRPDNSHIEHIKPQSRYPQMDLDYDNMIGSCNGFKEKQENCGHKKDDWCDDHLLVSPLDCSCEGIFEYTVDGHIKSTYPNGIETIERLGLESPLLIRARRSAIHISGLFEPDFEESKVQYLEACNTPNEEGALPQFCKAAEYCMQHIE